MAEFAFRSFSNDKKTKNQGKDAELKEIDSLIKKAFADGEAKGKMEGEAIGYEKGLKDAAENSNELNQNIINSINENAANSVQNLIKTYSAFELKVEEEFEHVIRKIVEKFFNKIATLDFSEEIIDSISIFFDKNAIKHKVTIQVNQKIEEKITAFFKEKFGENFNERVTIKADDKLSTYDFIISDENGSYERILKNITKNMKKILDTTEK